MGPFPDDDRPPVERRKSYRCRVDESSQNGWLKVDERKIRVTILDESAGGFRVGFADAAVPAVGSILLLKTPTGCAEVQVMNISLQECEPVEEGVAPSFRARLGLERLRDVPPWEIAPQGRWSLAWLEFRLLANPARGLTRFLLGVAVMFVVSMVVAVVVLWNLEHPFRVSLEFDGGMPASGKRPKLSHPAAGSSRAHGSPKLAGEPVVIPISVPDLVPDAAVPSGILEEAGESLRNTVAGSSSDSPPDSSKSRAGTIDEAGSRLMESLRTEGLSLDILPQEILRRSFPQTLLQPRIANALALSPGQKEQLRRLYGEARSLADDAVQSFAPTQTEAASQPPSSAESELARRTLAILSLDQLRRWVRLVSAMVRPDPNAPQDVSRPAGK